MTHVLAKIKKDIPKYSMIVLVLENDFEFVLATFLW